MVDLWTLGHSHDPISQVLVLDQGKIAEFDSPRALLGDDSSIFYALCKATGANEFGELARIANAKIVD